MRTSPNIEESHKKRWFLFRNSYDINLRGRTLSKVDLTRAILDNVDLKGTDLSGASLIGTKLKNLTLSETVLRGAIYDDSTQWPEGFNVQKSGLSKLVKSGLIRGETILLDDRKSAFVFAIRQDPQRQRIRI